MLKKTTKNRHKHAVKICVAIAFVIILVYAGISRDDDHLPTAGNFVKLNKPSTYEAGKVKMMEFFKFNCGHCYEFHQMLPELEKKYDLEITYIPMLWLSMDEALIKSNEAYILAEKMGKGNEMKDALFKAYFVDRMDITSIAVLEDIGRDIGLGEDFVTALRSGDARKEAEEYIKLAESYQVYETPTIIINGNLKITPSLTYGNVERMVNNLDIIIGSYNHR